MAIILDGTVGVSAPAISHLDTPVSTTNGGTNLTASGSNTNVLTSDGTVWYSGAGGGGGITRGTVQDVTGLTYVDFTGIPSTAKRITVILYGCQTGASDLYLNVGTGGGIVASGYNSGSMICNNSGGISNNTSSTHFLVLGNQVTSTNDWNGIFTLDNITGNLWSFTGSGNTATAYVVTSGGRIDAGAAVTTIRVQLNGTNFTSGKVNIFYE